MSRTIGRGADFKSKNLQIFKKASVKYLNTLHAMSLHDARSDLAETSRALEGAGPAAAIEKLTADLEESMYAYERKANLLVNRACVSLALEMTNIAVKDCNEALKNDQQCALALFVRGIAQLWSGCEEEALASWYQGLDNYCSVDLYFLMFTLINNGNVRSWLNFHRFDVQALLDLAEDWSSLRNFTDGEKQTAFDELRMQNASSAVMHFAQIIEVDPQPDAYKGRGVARCLTGEWQEAVDDLTEAIKKASKPDESLKFRAFAFSALGMHLRAIADLSQYAKQRPDDDEAVLFRARLERMSGHYETAISLFKSVDQTAFSDQDWLAFSETLCEFGLYEKALDAINRWTKPKDHHVLYIEFLIHKGLGDLNAAKNCIYEAVESCDRRSQFLARNAAEFFFDIGDLEKACEFYEDSYTDRDTKEEADTRFNHACALLTLGKLKEACELLKSLSTVYYEPNSRTFGVETKMLRKPSKCEDKLRMSCAFHHFILSVMRAYNECISTVKLQYYPPESMKDEIECDLEFFKPNAVTITDAQQKMLEDADRLGGRCVKNNRRMQRVWGFCILRMAVLMRQSPVRTWQSVVEEMKMLLQFADWRKQMVDSQEDYMALTWIPTHYIVKNSRPVRRHLWAREQVYNIVKKQRPEIHDIRDLFIDRNSNNFCGTKCVSLSDDTESDLLPPVISVLNQGALGYDITVTPRCDMNQREKYETALSDVFTNISKKESSDLCANIARAVLLIWIEHSMEDFTEEFALAFLHAAILAFTQNEISGSLPDSLFMQQLLVPDYRQIEAEISKLPQARTSVRKPSVEFWKTLPSFATLVALVNQI